MHKFVFLAPALLSACAAAPPPIPVHGAIPGHKCETAATGSFIGQVATSQTGAAILRASNSAILRWAPPGTMLTMDYSESRVTVFLDAANTITDIKCG